MSELRLIYRISDASYAKPKLPGTDKATCFLNFCRVFCDRDVTILADRCSAETLAWLRGFGHDLRETNSGNAGSFATAMMVAADFAEDDIVYFVEDDYLHRDGAEPLLADGLRMAEYVTLYDHPDKYTKHYGNGEVSQVRRTRLSHWRYTQSTCMTFATRVGTLLADWEVWAGHLAGVDHPPDHTIFTALRDKGRKLIQPVPGYACHTDLTFSGHMREVLIDPWALELSCANLEHGMSGEKLQLCSGLTGWERLKMLEAISKADLG